MKISDFLDQSMVIPDLLAQTKTEILKELAARLATQLPGLTVAQIAAVLAERESMGSTAIGDGIAIPHGKLAGVSRIWGVFGRSPRGVDFDSLDGNPTYLFFLLVAPEDSASLHLKALARVSRLFKDAAFRRGLVEASDGAEIYRLITQEDAKF